MRSVTKQIVGVGLLLAFGAGGGALFGARVQQQKDSLGYQDTPIIPGHKWHIHDGLRPQPKEIEPGTFSSNETPGTPPSDATVLFDGKDVSHWTSESGKEPGWKVENGYMEVASKEGIMTKDQLGDCQLHIEWAAPTNPTRNGQERGNSGVLFFGRYEIQVLDSYHAPTYPDGQASAIYGSYPPLVNATRKPGEWQTYDIIFTVPRFEGEKLVKPGYFTVIHNGVVVHNHAELLGTSNYRALPNYVAHPPQGALHLQNHGNPVRYRNIWYRELKDYDQP